MRRTWKASSPIRARRCQRAATSSARSWSTVIAIPRSADEFDRLIAAAGVSIAPVTADQARIARAAYRDFGRGSGHPAQLNFGDCFAYALAIDRDEPLLYKGNDFSHTDVRNALAEP